MLESIVRFFFFFPSAFIAAMSHRCICRMSSTLTLSGWKKIQVARLLDEWVRIYVGLAKRAKTQTTSRRRQPAETYTT